MSLKATLGAAAALALLLAWVAPAAAQDGSITGRVTSTDTGEPVAGAQVEAISAGGAVVAQAVTGAQGDFRLSNVPPGSYAIVVTSLGYETQRLEAVQVTPGATSMVGLELRTMAFNLNPVVVTASRQTEMALEAPASVSVVSEAEIDMRPAITPVEHLRSTPGIDIVTQGIQSTNVVARGFNNIFSGALYTLTDYRIASVPSLRVNVMHFVPATDEDLERMEVVLGPGSALYGPNTANGVLHLLTKSPLTAQGTSLSLTTGERGLLHGTARTAQRLGDRIGLKASGQYVTADEWRFVDPVEVAERAKFDVDPFFKDDLMRAVGISAAEADRRIALIGARNNEISRWSGEARLDWRASDQLSTVFTSGITNVGNAVELTGLGAAQVQDWRYSFVQARANWQSLFVQGYVNFSNAGDTYLLRNGAPIVDESRLYVGQAQHGFAWGERQSFIYGGEVLHTNPETQGTISGIYEDEDQTTEIGGYVQSQTELSDQFELVLAGRLDNHSALPDPIFSPRAALVFTPVENQAFRLTYNRAFSTPTSLNQFLDLPTALPDQATNPLNAAAARLGYSVRVQGTGTQGFQFQQNGGYLMRVPGLLGGPSAAIPANVEPFWAAAVGLVAQTGALPANLVQYLASLQPQGAINTMAITEGGPVPLSALNLPDIDRIQESTTSTFEAGYKGILGDRLLLAADLWFSQRENLVTPLTVSTPLLTMSGPDIAAFLVPRFMQDLGMSQAEATATATQVAAGLAQVPLGVVTAPQVNATGAQLLATYTNVDEELDLWGTDLAATLLVGDHWALNGTASFVSDDHWETESIALGVVTLNAPSRKFTVGTQYNNADRGLAGEARIRYNNEFPVQSGVFTGTRCIDPSNTATETCVESYTLFDVTLGYTFPGMIGAAVQLSVQNLLDEEYRSYPGTPLIGRLAVLRLKYAF
ncbi:MAG: TonB-dependent receptor domain-containing protein [Longimicrobiales bacterium]